MHTPQRRYADLALVPDAQVRKSRGPGSVFRARAEENRRAGHDDARRTTVGGGHGLGLVVEEREAQGQAISDGWLGDQHGDGKKALLGGEKAANVEFAGFGVAKKAGFGRGLSRGIG